MVYKVGDVRPGKCFATSGEAKLQVRRVRSVTNGQVIYEAREQKARRSTWSSPVEISMEDFLAAAAREVGCDYVG